MKVNIVFDGPPGPEPGRFVEVEDLGGHGLSVGEWMPYERLLIRSSPENILSLVEAAERVDDPIALDKEMLRLSNPTGMWVLQLEVPDDTVTR